MRNTIKRAFMARFSILSLAMLTLCARSAFGFALLGPFNEPYQVINLDYGFADDIGAPKNIGEEYRWNTPVLYYTFDQNFFDYFGEKGVEAVEQAIAILNSLTNVSAYSAELSEFPLESMRVNYLAQGLGLVDVKSIVLHALIEQLGLAEPDRYVWTLRNRVLPPGATCPAYDYTVIKRNFDPVTYEPSSYVNGTLYSYVIAEFCPTPDRADALEIPVDPLSNPFSAVASPGSFASFGPIETDLGFVRSGFFYLGLTRDDVGGLRYLLQTNNANFESVAPGSDQFVTNTTSQPLFGSNLTLLGFQTLTNNAAALQALYPGLVVTSESNYLALQPVTNFTAFLTNPPWAPAGTFTLGIITNITFVPRTFFTHTFANVVTIQSTNGQLVAVPFTNLTSFVNPHITLLQTASVVATNPPWAPPTSIIITSNLTTKPILTNLPTGEFFILPTNACDFAILRPVFTNIVGQTNFIINFTNGTIITNVNGGSNNIVGSQVIAFQQFTVDIFTNHIYEILPISCVPNTVDLRQGVEKITFVRRDFDSLESRTFPPITNIYSINAITNSQVVKQTFRRAVTQPDILFSAQDLVSPPTTFPIVINIYQRDFFAPPHLDTGNANFALAGPGTIQPNPPGVRPVTISLNKIGPIFLNLGPAFVDEGTAIPNFIWASYDGTTNLPVIYPSGNSISNLQYQLSIQIQLSPDIGQVGIPFSAQISVNGGTPPYSFSLASYSPPMAPGLSLSGSGAITGTPQQAGTFPFVVHLTDAGALDTYRAFSITINP